VVNEGIVCLGLERLDDLLPPHPRLRLWWVISSRASLPGGDVSWLIFGALLLCILGSAFLGWQLIPGSASFALRPMARAAKPGGSLPVAITTLPATGPQSCRSTFSKQANSAGVANVDQ
jgi:hypothetical protein